MNKLRNALAFTFLVLLLAVPAASAAKVTNPLLVRPGEMPGFGAAKVDLHTARSAPIYVHRILEEKPSANAAKKIARLEAEGFREGAAAVLVARHGNAQALTRTLLLGSPGFARGQQREEFSKEFGAAREYTRTIRFTAPRIPGATGFVSVVPGSPEGAANLYFTSGSCVFAVGDYLAKASVSRLKNPVLAGAMAVYRRTKSICTS
jgi:hypothetical protein